MAHLRKEFRNFKRSKTRWARKQLSLWDIPWPPPPKWRKRYGIPLEILNGWKIGRLRDVQRQSL
jgi:hypothetical protein